MVQSYSLSTLHNIDSLSRAMRKTDLRSCIVVCYRSGRPFPALFNGIHEVTPRSNQSQFESLLISKPQSSVQGNLPGQNANVRCKGEVRRAGIPYLSPRDITMTKLPRHGYTHARSSPDPFTSPMVCHCSPPDSSLLGSWHPVMALASRVEQHFK